MQDGSSYAPMLVIVACGNTVEVTIDGRLIRFTDADPALVLIVSRSAAFPPLLALLRHLASPEFWPLDESELTLPAAVLESAFREARLLEAA
ncbi:hypothetical protein [Sabulicella glaciei]|uniref:Uncharacterized protein n=1 Tax=Sabulicella glaciei TaxID=2984948 RepID=A0ABT3P1Q6_9PROT|nr:hypothetical protein [Roseococcus sp. MDT2-1-1]MCW8088321.1 hypothetical protein [Roseococcus sp. MDT2-1-1]